MHQSHHLPMCNLDSRDGDSPNNLHELRVRNISQYLHQLEFEVMTKTDLQQMMMMTTMVLPKQQ